MPSKDEFLAVLAADGVEKASVLCAARYFYDFINLAKQGLPIHEISQTNIYGDKVWAVVPAKAPQ